MKVIKSINGLRNQLFGQSRIAFVPTMGHIHEGHLSLIKLAKLHGDPVICSIFVNPLQFSKNEDFDKYPRSVESDILKLEKEGIYVVFIPETTEMYPQQQEFYVSAPKDLGSKLEGEFRPSFFTGVTTIVLKLFQCVEPKVAIFGKKDYQQLLVIKQMCNQFFINTKIIAAETVRDKDGLALSSRNFYLDKECRGKAPLLYSFLTSASEYLQNLYRRKKLNSKVLLEIEINTIQGLQKKGWKIDYVKICKQDDLNTPTDIELINGVNIVILAAGWLGSTRLIDNLEITWTC